MDNEEDIEKAKRKAYYQMNRNKILARYHRLKYTEEFKKRQAEKYQKTKDLVSMYNSVYYALYRKNNLKKTGVKHSKKENVEPLTHCPKCNIRIKQCNLLTHMNSDKCHKIRYIVPKPEVVEVKNENPKPEKKKRKKPNKKQNPEELFVDQIKITFD